MQIWTELLNVIWRFIWKHQQAAIVIMDSTLFFYKTRLRMRNIVQDQVVSFYHFNKNQTLATPLWRHDDRMKRQIQSWSEKEWNVILWKENFISSTVNRGLWESGQEEIMLDLWLWGRTGQCEHSVCCLSYDTIHTEWRMSPSKSSVKYKEMASSGSTLSWGQELVNLNLTREE